MGCPICKGKLAIPENSERNMESYRNSIRTITTCCGGLINVFPRFSYTVHKYIGDDTKDNWGRESKIN